MKILIKNGHVINPDTNLDEKCDILIENNSIEKVGKNILEPKAKIVDATGLVVMPGFIDMHTHLRQPGKEYSEDFYTAGRAAVKGGFTSICAMPNTTPEADTRAVVEFVKTQANTHGLSNVYPIGCITLKSQGKELVEMADLKQAGAIALSDDGHCIADSNILKQALLYAKSFDILIIEHCEDACLFNNGTMNEGLLSLQMGLRGIPSISESIAVNRDVQIAEYLNYRIHIAHLSTKQSVEIIRLAKKRGVNVTCEVTPHHISLTENAVLEYNTYAKVNPPLRTSEDIECLKKALKDGIIDCIATDHAPHIDLDKNTEFEKASFGMIGLQTAFSVALEELVEKNKMTLKDIVRLMSTNPARILRLDKKGSIKETMDADLVIVDPQKQWTLTPEVIESKSRNTPFLNKQMKGWIHSVIINGNLVLKNGEFEKK